MISKKNKKKVYIYTYKQLDALKTSFSNIRNFHFQPILQCMKITSVRATGVASAIVDVLQTNGFTMQSLNLGFDDEAEAEPDFFSFTNTKFVDDDQPQQRSS